MCVGGLLAKYDVWKNIQRRWKQVIDHENSLSKKAGHRIMERYHANTCANLKGDFREWSQQRQIKFVKSLVAILGKYKPYIFANALSKQDYLDAYSHIPESQWKGRCYEACMAACIADIGAWMQSHNLQNNDELHVFHESHDEFNTSAQNALIGLRQSGAPYKNSVKEVTPLRWQDCIALQPADFIAYETMKLAKQINAAEPVMKDGRVPLRKTITALMGLCVPAKGSLLKREYLLMLGERHRKRNHPE